MAIGQALRSQQKKDFIGSESSWPFGSKFCTGDEHQEFVPVERVINGIIASLELYLTTVVNVESGPNRAFTSKDFYKQEPLKTYLIENDKNRKLLHVLSGMWMPFTEESLKAHFSILMPSLFG